MTDAAPFPAWGGFETDTALALREAVVPKLDALAAELTELYRRSIPVYEHFDPAEIQRNSRLLLGLAADQLGVEHPTLSTDGVLEFARDLADQGTPLGPVAHSFQLGARHVVRLLRDSAVDLDLDVPADEVAAMQDAVWQWATDCATVIQAVEREVAIAGATRRADFLRRLVAGDLTATELDEQAARHRLDPGADYRVACAAAPASGSLAHVVTSLRVHGRTSSAPVVDAIVDDVLVALLPTLPTQPAERVRVPVPVGVGPALPLARARTSYEQARRALDIAGLHGLTGLLGLADLGARTLLHVADDAADLLHVRHLAPLRELGATGQDVLTTAATYLRLDRRVDETAAALHLHRNSVRYRLSRFGEVTGLDLDRTDDLVLAWWLLGREEVAR